MGSFWRGFVACWAVTSLIQDYIGKEAYLKKIEEGWIDASITVPIAITVLMYVLVGEWTKDNDTQRKEKKPYTYD